MSRTGQSRRQVRVVETPDHITAAMVDDDGEEAAMCSARCIKGRQGPVPQG
jgi:hypothetical protein